MLQQDILQIKQFQYRFFQNILLNEDTIPQIKINSQFLLKVPRFNYQLLWERQNQDAYINLSQVLTEIELLKFIFSDRNKHLHYRDSTSFSTHYFELIKFDDDFIVENSETSDNRPYTISNITSEASFEEYDQDIPQLNPDNNTQMFQNQTTRHHYITKLTRFF